jgi:spore maturation protein CgeB
MKILVAERWLYDWQGEIWRKRLQELGIQVLAFKESEYFRKSEGSLAPIGNLFRRFQHKYKLGPQVARLNAELVRVAKEEKVDAVFLIRGDLILPRTLEELRDAGVLVAGYCNDNPFSPSYPKYVWRHLIASAPKYDHYFAYRHSNVDQFKEAGCPKVDLLRSSYDRELHFPLPEVTNSPYQSDVVFVGHWEADGREEYLQAILGTGDVKLRIFGAMWEKAPNFKELSSRTGNMSPVLGADYNLAVNSAKIALVFLSKLNLDTYTRRCFEIPASGTFMLSEFSDDLASLFKEGVEAEYFRSKEELVEKTRYYLVQDAHRRRIAEAGRDRLMKGKHEALDRARQVVEAIQRSLTARRSGKGSV